MAEQRGSFGLYGPTFVIGDRAAVVAKRWTPIAVVVALPAGIWLIAHSVQWESSTVVGWRLVAGVCGVVLGMVGLALSVTLSRHD